MTALGDLIVQLRSTINRSDIPDATVISWVRMAEERFNDELRCKEMMGSQSMTLTVDHVSLPPNWIETDCIHYVASANNLSPYLDSSGNLVYRVNSDIMYGRAIRYCTNDEYASVGNDPNHPNHWSSGYTIIGDQLYITPAPDPTLGVGIVIAGCFQVPPLDGTNAVYDRFPSLYLNASLVFSAPFLDDDERLDVWAAQATASIQRINAAYEKAKRGNGPLHVRRRSFG